MASHADRPVLVTGAAGFAGGHLLDLLAPDTPSLVAWRRPGEALPPPPTGTSCRWMEVELLDRQAIDGAVEEIRPATVYHLAGVAHAGRSWDHAAVTLEVNVLGTHYLLSALGRLPERPRVLIPGSALVYRQQGRALTEDDPIGPASPYGLSKLGQEMVALRAGSAFGLPVLVTRSFNHIGPRQDPSFFAASFARQIACIERGLGEPVMRVGNLDARRDLTDVRDTVAAYRALLDRGQAGTVYNVCSGHAARVGDILEGLIARSKTGIEVRRDHGLDRPNDVPLMVGDASRIHEHTGWAPRIPLERTLDDLLAYWRNAPLTVGT